MNRYFLNKAARSAPENSNLFTADEYRQVNEFFQGDPSTPLWHMRQLAADLQVSDILVKDESSRMGLNAFKILGVSYAIGCLLKPGRLSPTATLACATEGNHGRAVARVARLHGLRAKVYMARDAALSRIDAIEAEGADVIIVDGNYDTAVQMMSEAAIKEGWTIVSDTSWEGYDEIPRLIMAGYTRILDEAEIQWRSQRPDVVLVQAGVGALAGAVVSWLCHRFGVNRPFTIVCEPASAACLLESARTGEPTSVNGPFDTIMAGLRSGQLSRIVWPTIAAVDSFVAIEDDWCRRAVRVLADPDREDPVIVAGASGACGLAALLAIMQDEGLQSLREAVGLNKQARVLVINTEGATDPAVFKQITGSAPNR